jgi:O-antigen/teichoic acid export membrane protein
MQWRLGVQGVFQFTATQLFAPILLYYHGPVAAGQFGMTWSLVSGVQTLTLASIHAQLPALALLAGRRETAALEHLWRRSSLLAVGGLTVAGAGLLAAVVVAADKQPALAHRMLGPLPTTALIVGVCCAQAVQCLATYVRAHKQEFLAPAGIAYSVTAAALGWALGRRFGAAGVVTAYLTATAAVALPIASVLWNRFRHGQAAGPPLAAEALRDRSR